MYIDKTLKYSSTSAFYPTIITRINNYIGFSNFANDGISSGSFAEFKFYEGVLSSDEIYASTYEPGLKMYYKFDIEDVIIESDSGVTRTRLANYASGYPVYDATVHNSATINDGILELNGVNQYISIDPFTTKAGGITITAWFKLLSGGWTRLFDFGNGNKDNIFYAPGNGLSVNTKIVSGSDSTGGYADDNWHYFAWTLSDDRRWNMYIDNTLKYSSISAFYPNTSKNNYIGFGIWELENIFTKGSISDFKYYERVLSPGEIDSTSTFTDFSPTWTLAIEIPSYGWYKVNNLYWNRISNRLYDISGNGKHAKTANIVSLEFESGDGATVAIPYLTGSTYSTILWPDGSIPSTFTICSVTRYVVQGQKQRILTGTTLNWYQGHHAYYGTQRGKAGYGKSMTQHISSVGVLTDWVVMCGKNGGIDPNNILVDGNAVGIDSGGQGGDSLSINVLGLWGTVEKSDWAFSELMIWTSALSDADMRIASNALLASLKGQPSSQPSSRPSSQPSTAPSRQPTTQPFTQPSAQPSRVPSVQPSTQPSSRPSTQPSLCPTSKPSRQPTLQPSRQPTQQPKSQPTSKPSQQPLARPSRYPSSLPTSQPSSQPYRQPTSQPSRQPSGRPSGQPSSRPSPRPVFPTVSPLPESFRLISSSCLVTQVG